MGDNYVVSPSENARRLKELRARAIGLRELARAIGWDPSRYQYYEDGFKRPLLPVDLIERIRPHIVGKGDPPVSAADLLALAGVGSAAAQTTSGITASHAKIPVASSGSERPPSVLPRDLPILGTVSHGAGGLQRMCGGAVDYARRPARLLGRDDVFAVWVDDPTMMPAFRAGALVLAERLRPPSIGDDVLLEIEPAKGDQPPAQIRRLISISAKTVLVEQFNPPRQLEYPRDRVTLYRVMTIADLVDV